MHRYTLIDLVTGKEVTIYAFTAEQALQLARAQGYPMTYYTIEELPPKQNRWNENRGIV